jgi:transmembrane sensor
MSNPSLDRRQRQPLQAPLARLLEDPVSETRVRAIWSGIAARRGSRPQWRAVALAFAAGVMLAAAIAVLVRSGFEQSSPFEPGKALARRESPLRMRGGSPVVPVEVAFSAGASAVELTDGSRFVVSPGARLEPLTNSGVAFVTKLLRGRVVFDVRPGGNRLWKVEAGPVEVEVVGTRFSVFHGQGSVRVEVERGTVLVRGAAVPNGLARLEAGNTLVVELEGAAPPASSVTSNLREPVRPDRQAEAAPPANARSEPPQRTTTGSSLSRSAEAPTPSKDLLAVADEARLTGQPERAVRALEQLLEEDPGSPRSGLAAVTLGRIELELGHPARAATAFERALRLGVPQGLEEDVYARLVECHARIGHSARARHYADKYLARFPEGRRKPEITYWLVGLN